jgi:capsid protein
MARNNPLVKGLLRTERNGVVGRGVKIHARTGDPEWNKAAEALWKEEMVDRPCETTGRFGYNQYLRMLYLGYRRDGDDGTILLDNGKLQAFEGEQLGTPWGKNDAKNFRVVNGIAYSNKTNRVIGYYIGIPNKWGFIGSKGYQKYPAEKVIHSFSPERFSSSRGEPALTSSVDYIDKLCKYVDAELVAACVNAAFSMFIARKDDMGGPPSLGNTTDGGTGSGTGTDEETGNREEKIGAGTIIYGETGESATGIGQTRPGAMFDPFMLRMLSLIGRPLCMPLMLITLDYAGATFMNARVAYMECRENWEVEQEIILKSNSSRVWIWWVERKIKEKALPDRPDAFLHEVQCRTWPYVDPFKQSKSNQQNLENRTITRSIICSGQGLEYEEINKQLKKEDADIGSDDDE